MDRVFLTGVPDSINKKLVNAPVVRELRMKGRCEKIPLTDEYREPFAPGEDLDAGTDSCQTGSTNEYHFERTTGKRSGLGEDGGINLPTVSVAFDDGIEQTQGQLRWMKDLAGDQYCACTGAEHRACRRKFFERLEEPPTLEEFQHGGGFTARQDESIQGRTVQAEVFWILHQRRDRTGFNECVSMSSVVALNSQDTDARRPYFCPQSRSFSVSYQPRVCSSCDSSMAAAARPFIVPVTCSLTSARILGSL